MTYPASSVRTQTRRGRLLGVFLMLLAMLLTATAPAVATTTGDTGTAAARERAPEPRPDLSGVRIKSPSSPAVYLIDPEGYRRWIPNPATYNNLFRDWNGIVVDINTRDIAERAALSNDARLVRPVNEAPVYLVSNGIKRWITSPAAMDKYYFDWGKVLSLPKSVVEAIPEGSSWS